MNKKMKNIIQSIIDNLKGFENEIKSVGKDYYNYDRIEWLKKPFNSDDKKDIKDVDDETIITLLIQRYLFDEIIYEKDGKVIDRAK
jgi:hypothetical protein